MSFNGLHVLSSIPAPAPIRGANKIQSVVWKEVFCVRPRRCKNTNKLLWFSKVYCKQEYYVVQNLYITKMQTSWYCPQEALLEQLKG